MAKIIQIHPTCASVDPKTGVQCAFPAGHENAYQCSKGILSWDYNPPRKPKSDPPELFGEG
jgi:hypothetical protein